MLSDQSVAAQLDGVLGCCGVAVNYCGFLNTGMMSYCCPRHERCHVVVLYTVVLYELRPKAPMGNARGHAIAGIMIGKPMGHQNYWEAMVSWN